MEVELQALANHSGAPPLDVAMAQAQDGDPLELDLLMSGWYDNSDMGESVGTDARHEVALRSLGDLLARIREAAITRRWGTDENTLLNMAMRHGHHYVEVDRARRAVVERPAPRNAVRRTVQKFEPWFRQHHGRLSAGKPRYTLKPSSRQQTDRDAATFAKKLAGWLTPTLFPFRYRADLSQWKLLAGKVVYFLGVKWVPDDEYMVDPATGEPVLRPELDPAILPPQVCWCDDRIPHVEDMRWFGRDVHVPMPEAIASYPEHAERLMPVSVLTSYGHQVLRRVQRFTGVEDPWGGSVEGGAGALAVDEEEETTIPEFYLRPGATLACGFLDWLDPEELGAPVEVIRASDEGKGIAVVRFPEGLKVCFTPDGYVVRSEGNFYGTLPFVSMSFSKSPGFWCVAPATPMRSLQIAFNWVFSMREAHAIKTGNAPLMQPREARISRRGGLTNAFARILYRANRFGAKPEYLSPPQIGVDVAALQTSLEMAWQDIGGIHEVSQAKLPSADLSGVTVS
ncbi:MAG TPA: hypothetical protein VFJ82_01580, partial [Longimicrobium sp.]|nr:hypothetical protein [Longimicrobium sp.]